MTKAEREAKIAELRQRILLMPVAARAVIYAQIAALETQADGDD